VVGPVDHDSGACCRHGSHSPSPRPAPGVRPRGGPGYADLPRDQCRIHRRTQGRQDLQPAGVGMTRPTPSPFAVFSRISRARGSSAPFSARQRARPPPRRRPRHSFPDQPDSPPEQQRKQTAPKDRRARRFFLCGGSRARSTRPPARYRPSEPPGWSRRSRSSPIYAGGPARDPPARPRATDPPSPPARRGEAAPRLSMRGVPRAIHPPVADSRLLPGACGPQPEAWVGG
jgi:hypothetical protein